MHAHAGRVKQNANHRSASFLLFGLSIRSRRGECLIEDTRVMHDSFSKRWTLGLLLSLSASLHAANAASDSIGDFEIARFDVTGNTLLEPSVVQARVSEFAGSHRDFSYVERAQAALQGAYRERGFSLVKVVLPEQELNDGVVHLSVVETRIGQVRVAGNEFHNGANVRRSLPTIVENTVPNTDEVSANLRMVNQNPSRRINLQLQSAEVPGVVDAVVQVEDSKDWSASMLVDNSGDESTGRTHVTAQYQNFNVGGWDHVFSAQYTTSPENPSKISVYGAGYHIPFYSLRDSLDFYGSYSNVDAGAGVCGFGRPHSERRWHSVRHALQSRAATSRALRFANHCRLRSQGIPQRRGVHGDAARK